MSGYIGSKASVTQVDGYNRTEADDRYVNASGDTMTGNLTTTGNIKATNGLLAGANNTYLYEGASNTLNIRIGETGPYAEFVDAGSGVLKIGNAGGRLSLTSNGIERVHLDDAGRVTMPYQPAFRAKFVSSSQSGAAGIWVFDSVETNVGSGYNSSNGRFTAPVAGRYLIMATAQHYGGTSTGGYVDVYQNGSLIRGMRMEWSNTVSFETRGVSGVFDVSAGDYFHVYNASGTASHLDHSSFSGYLIG